MAIWFSFTTSIRESLCKHWLDKQHVVSFHLHCCESLLHMTRPVMTVQLKPVWKCAHENLWMHNYTCMQVMSASICSTGVAQCEHLGWAHRMHQHTCPPHCLSLGKQSEGDSCLIVRVHSRYLRTPFRTLIYFKVLQTYERSYLWFGFFSSKTCIQRLLWH